MFDIKNVLDCIKWNLYGLRKNPRFILASFMGILICFFLTQRTVSLSYLFYTKVQIFEPFIWCFSDSESIIFSSFALILPMTQIPKLDTADGNLLFRKGKINLLLGQFISIIIIAFLYIFLLLLTSSIMTLANVSLVNEWSDTATIMSLNPDLFESTMTVVRATVKLSTPYECVLQIFLLLVSYMLFLMSLNLFLSLKFGKKIALGVIMSLSFACYILKPEYFSLWFNINEKIKYIANLMSVWFSPLQHASYTMHTYGYDDLPSVGQSLIIFLVVSFVMLISSFLTLKFGEIDFKEGEND